MNLFHIKLINGDEIISQLGAISADGQYCLRNPLILMNIQDDDSGSSAIVLHSYAPFSNFDEEILIDKSQIVSTTKVHGNMIDYYKVSLDFAVLYNQRELNSKIKLASDHLRKYIKHQIDRSLGNVLKEDDIDMNTLESMTSSNTTYH